MVCLWRGRWSSFVLTGISVVYLGFEQSADLFQWFCIILWGRDEVPALLIAMLEAKELIAEFSEEEASSSWVAYMKVAGVHTDGLNECCALGELEPLFWDPFVRMTNGPHIKLLVHCFGFRRLDTTKHMIKLEKSA